jgi:hypothetical protein
MITLNKTFDPETLADDLLEVRRIYTEFFAAIRELDWDKTVKGSPKEWNLHETVAHLCALNGDGLESIMHTLRSEPYTFVGLEDRYQLNAFNRKGINDHLHIPMKELCAEQLGILDEAARIARDLSPYQAKLTALMPIYNRPVSIVEAPGDRAHWHLHDGDRMGTRGVAHCNAGVTRPGDRARASGHWSADGDDWAGSGYGERTVVKNSS